MTNALVGANPDELDRAADQLRRSAERIASVHGDLRRLVQLASWKGRDAERFEADWSQRGRASLEGAAGLLRSAADTLARNAADQRRTSEAEGVIITRAVGAAPAGPPGPGYPDPAGLSPQEYRDQLRQYWLDQALAHAGIDPNTWNPAAGSEANRHTIEAVYTYYGQLFLDHPELQWAGMANMIGPSFAAGFFDLASMRDVAGKVDHAIDRLPPGVEDALPPGVRQLGDLAEATDEDLAFYETTFLTMQKDIFIDQAVMHEAYLQGGLPAIEDLRRAGILDDHAVEAWRTLHEGAVTGDRALLAEGNTELLHREQWQIIPRYYDEMRNHEPTGEAMTYTMTLIGQATIPGTHFYGEVFPLGATIETPGPEHLGTPSSVFGVPVPHVSVDNPLQGTVTIETPLPDGNISDRVDRWNLITHDTLPAYQDLLANDPERARAIIATPVDQRIDASRLEHRIDDIAGQIDNWSIRASQ